MTAHILHLPVDDAIFARLTEQQRLANMRARRAEAVQTCKDIIDDPRGYSDAQLREVCGFYMALSLEDGGGGAHYLRADQHIYAINKREWQARNCPRPVEPQYRWQDVVAGTAAFVFVGWAVLTLLLAAF